MMLRALAVAAAILGGAGVASAGGFAPVIGAGPAMGTAPAVVIAPGAATTALTDLEWLRYSNPWIGQQVIVPTAAGSVPTIEWLSHNEVRVRSESGAPLSVAERAAIRTQALVCRRGEVRNPSERLERNGTFVVEYDCARLQ